MKQKNNNNKNDMPSFEVLDDLLSYIQSPISSETKNSDIFYDKHRFLCEILRGNYGGIERVAFELCQRQYLNKEYYSEVRCNPYFLSPSFHTTMSSAITLNEFDEIISVNDLNQDGMEQELRNVIEAVINGLNRGCK